MSSRRMYFKVVKPGLRPCVGPPTFQWDRPINTTPGKWAPKVDDPQMCSRGYHLAPATGLASWLPLGDSRPSERRQLFVAEGRGYVKGELHKTLFREARLLYQVHDDLITEFVDPLWKQLRRSWHYNVRYQPQQPLPRLRRVIATFGNSSDFVTAVKAGVWESEVA